MRAGYSKRSLVDKLGIQTNSIIAILHAPSEYDSTLGELPSGVHVSSKLNKELPFIQAFFRTSKDLERQFPILKKSLSQSGALWISWPKKASKMQTDITEDVVRAIAVRNGLVDIKVCAVDEVWSGLKLVYSLKDRR